MKKLFLLLFVVMVTASSFAQEKTFVYCQLLGKSNLLGTKVTVEIDNGNERKFFSAQEKIVDEEGKPIKFNSMVDAMNYMGNEGWEFVQAYTITIGNSHVYHWLLKKEAVLEEKKEDLF